VKTILLPRLSNNQVFTFETSQFSHSLAFRMTVLLGVVLSAAKHLYDEQSMIEDPLV